MTQETSRRSFIAGSAALACGLALPGAGRGQPTEKFDLVIRGGTIVDPARGMQATADLGIRAGRIASIEPQLADALAARHIDAKGQYVTPALIDMHAQVYARHSAARAPADELAGTSGITAWVSAGDVDADDLAAFRQYSARHNRCRIYAFVNFDRRIAARDTDSDERIARDLAQHREVALGFKLDVLESGDGTGLAVLDRALEVLKRSQIRGRVLCHVSAAAGTDAVLERLRPGDILTQPFRSAGNAFFDAGKFRPSIVAARNRGVILDVGHAGAQFDARIARAGIEQGLMPDVISSALRLGASPALAQPRLTAVMSAFLNLGLSLDQVLAMTTVNPARIIGREPHLGTLALGAPADIAVLKLSGSATPDLQSPAALRIEPILTLRSGVPLPR